MTEQPKDKPHAALVKLEAISAALWAPRREDNLPAETYDRIEAARITVSELKDEIKGLLRLRDELWATNNTLRDRIIYTDNRNAALKVAVGPFAKLSAELKPHKWAPDDGLVCCLAKEDPDFLVKDVRLAAEEIIK